MRVYHFVNEKYGLEDLRERRLKIARIMELNDPFEFIGADLSDGEFRQAMESTKQGLSEDYGLLCFSKSWNNPVQWAHYADKHKGLCLGFEVPGELLREVVYRDTRLPADEFVTRKKTQSARVEADFEAYVGEARSREEFEAKKSEFIEMTKQRNRAGTYSDNEDREFMERNLATKFSHWSYEQEYRFFTSLVCELVSETDGVYYFRFSEQLKLTEVIVGVRSCITRKEVADVMGKITGRVEVFKVRQSHNEFAVVREKSSEF